jgi:hypothetical protein
MDVHLDEDQVKNRRMWPLAVRHLHDADTPSMPRSSAQERLAAVAELTRQAWSLAGLELPDYPRHATPVKLVPSSDLPRAPRTR